MIELKPSGLADLSYVIANMRDADRAEIFCQLPDDINAGQFANSVLNSNDSVTAFLKGNPVAAFWLSEMTVSTAFVSMFGTKHMIRTVPAMTRAIMEEHIPAWRNQGFIRFEARSLVEHTQAHKWLKGCGAKNEGILKSMGKNGEDFFMFGLVYRRI